MADALIVVYGHPPNTPTAQMNRLRQALFGYTDRSNRGRYEYRRPGLLTNHPYLVLKHTLVLPLEFGPAIEAAILQEGAWVWMRRVRLTKEDAERLRERKTG